MYRITPIKGRAEIVMTNVSGIRLIESDVAPCIEICSIYPILFEPLSNGNEAVSRQSTTGYLIISIQRMGEKAYMKRSDILR
jgi:hypothetical protein